MSTIAVRTALEIARTPQRATWLLRPYVERRSSILMFGEPGTFKSFLALDWAMRIAQTGAHVLYLSAEGKGLWRRLRAWCVANGAGRSWEAMLKDMRGLVAVEVPLNLNSNETLLALQTALEESFIRPSLVVVDTLSTFSAGLAEDTNRDAASFLFQLDQGFRVKYDSSILFVHHSGHSEKQRARGASALLANTDANFYIERPDVTKHLVVVRSGRMKDSLPPPPFEVAADVIELDVDDEDGQRVTSLALHYTNNTPTSTNRRPTGKAQRAILAELERLAGIQGAIGIWTIAELNEIGRGLNFHKNTARDAVLGLKQMQFVVPAVGGHRLADHGTNGPKRTESTDSVRLNGTETTESPLGLGLSCPAHVPAV